MVTPGKWISHPYDGGPLETIRIQDETGLANGGFMIAEFAGPDRVENAALCVNAPQTLKERDELLEALEYVIDEYVSSTDEFQDEKMKPIRDLIARIGGGKG